MTLYNQLLNRWRIETTLLVCATLFWGAHFFQLIVLTPQNAHHHIFVFGVWVIATFMGKLVLDWRLPQRDSLLFPLAMFLCGWGLLILERLTPTLALQQTVWFIVALCGLLLIVLLPIVSHQLDGVIWGITVLALGLVVLTFFVGVHPSLPRGAPALWLSLSRVFVQPTEFLKLALIGFFAVQVAYNTAWGWRNLLLLWGIGIGLLIFQRDFGMALLFGIVLFQLVYLAEVRWQILGIVLIFAGIGAGIAYMALPIVRLRVDIWLNPAVDVMGSRYQFVQSLRAFGDSGLFGQGFGMGNPARIPLAHSDFIFSAIADEWGFGGVLLVIICVGMLFWRSIAIGRTKADKRLRFLAYGVGLMCISQNIIIMAGTLGILPLTGMPLTFLSYGGSSLVVSMMMVGVLLRLSANLSQESDIAIRVLVLRWGIGGILTLVAGVALYWGVLAR